MNRVLAVSYQFMLEFILGILFLFLFYINKNELPPIFLLAAICIGSIFLFTILLTKFFDKGKWLYFVTVFPVLLVVGHFAHFSIIIGLLLGLFLFWRGISLFDDFSTPSEGILLLLSFLIGLVAIIYAAMSQYYFTKEITYVLFSQILSVLIGGFIRKWNSIQADRLKFALYFLKMIVGIMAMGVALTFLMKYIQFIYFGILHLAAWLFSSMAAPIFSIFQYLLSLFGNNESHQNLNVSDVQGEAEKYQDQSYGLTENILYILLILAAISFIIYLFYKMILKRQTIAVHASPFVTIIEGEFGTNQSSYLRRRVKPPADIIRREIFELEKYAHKLKLGRFPYETLEEWWHRVGLTGTGKSIEIYEKVRYGGGTSSIEEQILIQTEIRRLKQQVKEIDKVRKDQKYNK